jgi:hypothetical protein
MLMTPPEPSRFDHCFEILPDAQKSIWSALKAFRDSFVLYGGTGLALRLGHRQSVDFDFFTDKELNHKAIMDSLPFMDKSEALQSEKNTYTILLPVEEEWVKLSFFGGIDFGRIASPELTLDENIWVASLIDLFATKLKVLMQRVEVKDYVDIAALLSHGLDLADGLAGTVALFGKQFSPADCLRALEYFEDPTLKSLDGKVKSTIKEAVKKTVYSNAALIPPGKTVPLSLGCF